MGGQAWWRTTPMVLERGRPDHPDDAGQAARPSDADKRRRRLPERRTAPAGCGGTQPPAPPLWRHEPAVSHQPLCWSLGVLFVIAIVIEVPPGHFASATAEALKPLGDGFIELVEMINAPIVLCTVAMVIAGMEDMRKVGVTSGLAPIPGIDRFMSKARALTNLIGNGVAIAVVTRWTGDLDTERTRQVLSAETEELACTPPVVAQLHAPTAIERMPLNRLGRAVTIGRSAAPCGLN